MKLSLYEKIFQVYGYVFTRSFNDLGFWCSFILVPYFVGIPIWYLNTSAPSFLLIEIIAPWVIGLIVIPSFVMIMLAILMPFYYIRDLWKKLK